MAYLLDSDVLIFYTNGIAAAHELIERIAAGDLAISAVSYTETQQGIRRSPHPVDAQTRLDELLEWVLVIAFGRAEARRCAEIQAQLYSQGRRVRQRALDLMIAATAIEHSLVLVTNNPADYRDVPALQLQTAQIAP